MDSYFYEIKAAVEKEDVIKINHDEKTNQEPDKYHLALGIAKICGT
jgi:hypothetical protein